LARFILSEKVVFPVLRFNFHKESWISVGWIEFTARKLDFGWLDLIYSKKAGFRLAGFNFQQESLISVGWIQF
jgi:hypothetical protein